MYWSQGHASPIDINLSRVAKGTTPLTHDSFGLYSSEIAPPISSFMVPHQAWPI
jgi:hypothetical protein